LEALWGRPGSGAIAPARGIAFGLATSAGWLRREEAIMGTAVHAELWAGDRRQGEAALEAVMQEMHRIDRLMSPHRDDSELSRINRDAGTRPVRLSDEMFDLLARAIEFSRWSDGAFDISYAAVGQLYDYRRGVQPGEAERTRACAAVGWQQLILDPERRTLRFGLPGMRIDLGGFAKGHAVDNAVAILRERGIEHASVAAGGDSHLMGDRRGRPWTLAIRDPRRATEVVALLPLENVAVSTSGDYERCFIGADGRRHHHLLDPRTGESPRAVRSVTVIAGDGLTTEALSKTVFVLGTARGLKLIDSLPGVDAVVVDADGVLHASNGLLDGGPTQAAGHA
jgi:thiamine biosynthesis lipoprotein